MVEYDTGGVKVEVDGKEIKSIRIERGGVDIKYGVHRDNDFITQVRVAAIQGERMVGGVDILNKGERAHIFHLNVSEDYRRRGIGSILINIAKEYILNSEYDTVSGRIKDAETKEFLESNGLNPSYLHVGESEGTSIYETTSITTYSAFKEHGHKHFHDVEDLYVGIPKRELFLDD